MLTIVGIDSSLTSFGIGSVVRYRTFCSGSIRVIFILLSPSFRETPCFDVIVLA